MPDIFIPATAKTLHVLRAQALAAIDGVDFIVGTEKVVRDLIAEAECCGSLHDALSNAGVTVRDDGEQKVEEAECLDDRLTGYTLIGVGKKLIEIGEEAGRESDRERIRDHERATLTAPASLVMGRAA